MGGTATWASSTVTGAPGNTPSTNNTYNFSAIPNGSNTSFAIWTATTVSSSSSIPTVWGIMYNSATPQAISPTASQIQSLKVGVRCLKDNPNTANPSSDLPTVTLTDNGAGTNMQYAKRLTANVTDNGGSDITERYIVCAKSQNPKYSASLKYAFTDNTAADFFAFSDLEPNTTYYVRACAKNSVGWSYSSQISFTTPADGHAMRCKNAATVTDANSNSYPTIQIGSQCWMAQNLRSTTYSGGGSITYKIPNNATSVSVNYGRLYTYASALNGSVPSNSTNVQGICPTGWHLPSLDEFNTLKSYLEGQSSYQCGSSSLNIAKTLASTSGWNESTTTCAIGNSQTSNNAAGFNAYPAGGVTIQYGDPVNYGYRIDFWLNYSTSISGDPVFYLYYDLPTVTSTLLGPNMYYGSVRCVKGNTPPSVATESVTSYSGSTATLGGNVYTTGGSTITEVGICYSTSNNPTIADSKATSSAATGAFNIDISGLTAGTTYYYRAYATNENGTQYGEVKALRQKRRQLYLRVMIIARRKFYNHCRYSGQCK